MTSPASTSSNNSQGMYVDYHIPLGLYDLVGKVISTNQNNPNTPQVPTPNVQQQWFSQPRSGTDSTTEVIQVNFKVPLSVSELQWDALRCACTYEAWYQDQQNNWRQVLDDNRIPVTVTLSTSTAASWYTAHFYCYPIIAKAVQWRITRNFDPQVGTLPYCVGMRNGLIRRNIYDMSDATQTIEPQQDLLGNTITSYVKSWDASQAIDNNTSTFWRSAALPDPQAVCSLFLDVRDPSGNPQLVDSLYIDPVYGTGTQQVNLYWSNDDTIPSYTTLSPVGTIPTTNENTNWQQGIGLWDISAANDSNLSLYEFPLQYGPLVNQDAWVGIEWTPDFAPLPSNAIQLVTITGGPTGGSWTLTYTSPGGGTQTTIGLPSNATAIQVQNALIALSNIGTNNVVVGGATGGPYQVTFTGSLGAQNVNTLTAVSSLTGGNTPGVTVVTQTVGGVGAAPPDNAILLGVTPTGIEGTDAIQTITISGAPTGGTFTLSYGGQTTSGLAYNATVSAVQAALVALTSIGANNVITTGDDGGPWTVQFVGTLANKPITTMTANPASLTGGSTPSVNVSTTTPGALPIAATPGQYVPTIAYNVGGSNITLTITDGTHSYTYSCPISPLFTQYQTLRIVVGWTYNPNVIYMQVNDTSGNVLGTLVNTSPTLPPNLSFDGNVFFEHFRGNFTAHVIKLENYSGSAAAFLANAQVYVSPDPVVPNAQGIIPSTTLNNAIYAAAWKVQQQGTGGADPSHYAAKVWTPIFSNYVVQKGMLYFPAQIPVKYLQLEFTDLTPESYPIYDSGIQVTYNTYPISVTTSTVQFHPGIGQKVEGLLTMGADVILQGLGAVNWLNPATVNRAVNNIYGTTTSSTTLTYGTSYSVTIPNTNGQSLAAQTSTEVSTPVLYRRNPLNPFVLAGNAINQLAQASVPTQGLNSIAGAIGSTVASVFDTITNIAGIPATLPTQGADYWVFPGANLRLPAAVMNGLTGLASTVTSLASYTATSTNRFSTDSVHQYAQRTVTRDAAVAYFAGIAEVQPYVLTYINGQDQIEFNFNLYDKTQWVFTNIHDYQNGVISTAGYLPELINPEFDVSQGITNWTQAQGTWQWDGTVGHWDLGTASVQVTGTEDILLSTPIAAPAGATLEASVWTTWSGLSASAGTQAIQMQVRFLNNGTLITGADASIVTAGLTYNPWPSSTPSSGGNTWAQIVFSAGTSNLITVPIEANQIQIGLVVTGDASVGRVWFDTVLIGNVGTIEGTAFKDFVTTSSFDKVTCNFTDSGLVRSDSMWAQTDPLDTNISNTALAYYTSTIPDVIPSGMWGDTVATWGDTSISWGEPFAVVSIQVDPNRVYDNKRVLNFSRAAGAGNAGIQVRQVLGFVPNGLFRLGCVFLKPNSNNNQVTLSLVRTSDGTIIYEETFNPVVGYWYNYVTSFIEIPNSDDQEYTIEFLCSGDSADQMYLNDLYTEIAGIRYFVRLGNSTAFLHDVTPLRYAGNAIVSSTLPVTEFSAQVTILGPDFYAYGASFTPNYLQ